MARIWMSLLGLIFVALSVTSIGVALRGAPAFDAGARKAGVYGDWRVQDARSMYSAPDYLFQLAFGYLQADTIASAATEGPDEIADDATALARAEIARELLSQSLLLAPGNAHVWGALAWAEAMLGNDAAARAALDASWELAPWNLVLGGQRAALAQVLAVVDPETPPSDQWTSGLARDLDMVERFGAGPLRDLLSDD
jgi:hypothetical protein